MVGILIVSHSARLAAGVAEFVQQVAGEKVAVAAVGGTEDGRIGTNPVAILEALQAMDSPDGTLIMVDLLGAIVSAETAIELAGDIRARISNAPLVEGAYFATLKAATGASLDEVEQEALKARELVKVAEAEPLHAVAAPASATEQPTPGIAEAIITVTHPVGLHARPARAFFQKTREFKSKIMIRNLSRPETNEVVVSPFNLLQIGVRTGHQIRLRAEGEDQAAAIATLEQFVKDDFGEKAEA
ncbi:MAG: PTS-dependent dihydroxyacetone kinase phosphotransferase subunit DhaM [Chloroflexaceae bacterium]|nr:PTS-dependent dihydroxyacetone kinase phosphotransferase subunit DhaM [Chloroflexaceae bacterium]NJL34685.1 PTS-dependent dihydroxyacetone kinase phosphotransferase subunit DhaM [Chloroflexaceae bacterium]NJO05533.1 PTS-dependent dihydroxyacetone kinase phosphotransferase subunit DhaM [Chloroflexaceae bacterium]